jgi:hypothetical protein
MIDLEINDRAQRVRPESGKALRELVEGALPPGHVIGQLQVDGRSVDATELGELDPERLRSIRVRSASPEEMARASLPETAQWLGRVCGVLEAIAVDYRTGREREAAARLVDVIDALQVLTALLGGIRRFLAVAPEHRSGFEQAWRDAEDELQRATLALHDELQRGDPVRLADRTGWTLPAALRRFAVLLEQLAP